MDKTDEDTSITGYKVCAVGHCDCNNKPRNVFKCSLYSIPNVRTSDRKKGLDFVKSREKLQTLWVKFIRLTRKDFTDKKIGNALVCGCHFDAECFDKSHL